jgi:hypothetical protein
MKTKDLLILFVFVGAIALNTYAQTQPPNAGFEDWLPVGPFENPAGWSSFNNFYSYGVPEMSFKTTDAHSGTYALRLISDTATVPPPLGTGTLDTLAGYVFLGNADMNNPGISYSDRPILMRAFVKGKVIPGNNAYLIATLRKWNAVSHVRENVGEAVYSISDTSSSYTQISVPFNYSLPDIPDTLEFKIMAGDVGPGGIIMPGNEIFIDDISFTFPVGITEIGGGKSNIHIFPNPTTDKITISSTGKINAIEIYDLLGDKVYALNNFGQQASGEIDLSGFHQGIYMVKIIDGEKIYTEKIVVQ